MLDLLSFGPQIILLLRRNLIANPLLTALFLISPPDALRTMGFSAIAGLLEDLSPMTPGDRAQAQLLVQALAYGRSTLEEVQIIQPAAPAEAPLLRPDEEQAPIVHRPDVQLNVSNTTLHSVLALYTRHTFNGRSE